MLLPLVYLFPPNYTPAKLGTVPRVERSMPPTLDLLAAGCVMLWAIVLPFCCFRLLVAKWKLLPLPAIPHFRF